MGRGDSRYADMGHFGRKPIRAAWYFVVLPALLLNYLRPGCAADPRAGCGGEWNGGRSGAGAEPGKFRARVLVVDDDQVDRMAVRRLLAGGPAEVTIDEADGVLAAIDRLAGGGFDCVVLDYNLPDGNGLTFLRGLRTAGLEVPVVMLTGQEDAGVARDLILAGAAAYILKARLSADLLLASLREAVRARP